MNFSQTTINPSFENEKRNITQPQTDQDKTGQDQSSKQEAHGNSELET